MSDRELGRLRLIKECIDGKSTVRSVALKLRITERRVKQLKKAYRERGNGVFVHGNLGRHPANYKNEDLRKKIVELKRSEIYSQTNFTHFMELLEEREGIKIGYTALSSILKESGIVSKKRHRTKGKRFKRRIRRAYFGELIQVDATSYAWFGIGKMFSLHGFIDDATGRIIGLYICENECLCGYLEVMRQMLTNYGVPAELYADMAGVFFINNKHKDNWTLDEMIEGKVLDKTQFGKITEDVLGIKMIAAGSPQAKGRIERLWGTVQDRLPIWFNLNGITDIDEANKALPRFIEYYNARFAVEPASENSAFVPVSDDYNLDYLLAARYERTTDDCGCLSYLNYRFQVEDNRNLANKKVEFLFSHKIGFRVYYNKEYYPVSFLGYANKKKPSPLHWKTPADTLPIVVKSLIQKVFLTDAKKELQYAA
jgi:transposase